MALAAFAAAGFAVGTAGRPEAAVASRPYAFSAPTAAPAPAPVQVAVAQPAAAVAEAARRPSRAAKTRASARLKAEPASFVSAEAPAQLPSALASMTTILRRLPKSAVPPRLVPRSFALAHPASTPASLEMVRLGEIHAEAHVFTVRQALSAEEVAEIRAAVIQAAAEGRKVKLRVHRGDAPSGGGGHGNGLDINIQTLVKGE